MDLFNDSSKAYSNAMRRFVRQKSDEPVYIYRVLVARREMWAVLSAAEASANKVSVNSCYSAIDGRYGLTDAKKRRQELLEKRPDLPYLSSTQEACVSSFKRKNKWIRWGGTPRASEGHLKLRATAARQPTHLTNYSTKCTSFLFLI